MTERLEQLQKLLDLDPADPFVTYGLAMEHLKLGQTQEALEFLDQTIELDANYHYAYFQKAKALHDLGQTDQAIAAVETGIGTATQAGDAKAISELTDLRSMLR